MDLMWLRIRIGDHVKDERLAHTLAVEKECTALAKLYLFQPYDIEKMKAAALLHDLTKAKKTAAQIKLYSELGLTGAEEDSKMPKIMHSKTAAAMIMRDFPEFSDIDIVNAVKYHTTGRAGMTLFEKILYLADYIEPTRTFEDCVKLRKYFYDRIKRANKLDYMKILNKTLILSFDMTMKALLDEGEPICTDTVEARNYLITHMSKF